MKIARAADEGLVVDLLARSFDDNPSVNYIVRQDEKRGARVRALMAYSFAICRLFGQVWLADDDQACALILYPERRRTTLLSCRLAIQLVFKAVGIRRIGVVMRRESGIQQKQLKVPMAYLWFIGVDPLVQGEGMGSRLLAEVLAKEKERGLPVFLETSLLRNIAWYERFGFRVYSTLELGYTLYFLNNLVSLADC